MFNKPLQDKALGTGKDLGVVPLPSVRWQKVLLHLLPTPSTTAEPISPLAKRTKASFGSFAQPAPNPSSRSHTPRPSPLQVKKEELGSEEGPSLLK
ncbi:UNVERIFIED_CONTAM: hypothetical protein Slati_4505900 [Sesamum latifolium]|uniref:Uncharacterized protein n=1 Tax=Sesamum latifolium TaxID=2727402 RepID=A0AAW2ST57_9LAMI